MNRVLSVLVASCVVCIGANGAINTTFEAAGVQNTTFGPVTVETFNSQPFGTFSGLTAVGTLSNGGEIIKPSDIYGGSTNYLCVGLCGKGVDTPGPAPYTYSLTFTSAQSYFGFYWAAMDGDDKIQFYSGASLLATYDWTIASGLPASYYILNGAEVPPTTKEAYAFVNFMGTGTTTFDKVVFTNGGPGTGLEVDNFTIGNPSVIQADVPEPATLGLMGASFALLALKLRKRKEL
jgi:hypothetical protein